MSSQARRNVTRVSQQGSSAPSAPQPRSPPSCPSRSSKTNIFVPSRHLSFLPRISCTKEILLVSNTPTCVCSIPPIPWCRSRVAKAAPGQPAESSQPPELPQGTCHLVYLLLTSLKGHVPVSAVINLFLVLSGSSDS